MRGAGGEQSVRLVEGSGLRHVLAGEVGADRPPGDVQVAGVVVPDVAGRRHLLGVLPGDGPGPRLDGERRQPGGGPLGVELGEQGGFHGGGGARLGRERGELRQAGRGGRGVGPGGLPGVDGQRHERRHQPDRPPAHPSLLRRRGTGRCPEATSPQRSYRFLNLQGT